MKTDSSHLRERLRAASENLASLAILVIGTGLFLGLATNIASSYLIERSPRWPWLLGSAVFTLVLPLSLIWLVYSRGHSTNLVLEIVLPLKVSTEEAEILVARPYPITRLLRQSFYWIMENRENRAVFLRDWRQALQQGERPFQGMPRRCVRDLLVYAVLDAFREYSDQTLTAKWIFSGHRWKATRLLASELTESTWPQRLRDNLCLQNQKGTALQVIRIPEGLALDVQDKTDETGIEKTDVVLMSKYGNLKFSISPDSQRISARSREGSILYKYCGAGEQSELWLARFYIQMNANFGGLRIFSRTFREDFLPWVEGLFECVRHELDWQLCLERDVERMLVQLTGQMESLLQTQTRSQVAWPEDKQRRGSSDIPL